MHTKPHHSVEKQDQKCLIQEMLGALVFDYNWKEMYKLQSKGLTCSDNSSIVGYTNPSGKSSAEGCCPGAVTW